MKIFRNIVAATLAGAVILAAGCANSVKSGAQPSDTGSETAPSESVTETTAESSEAPTEASEITSASSEESKKVVVNEYHEVTVEDLSRTTLSDGTSEFTSAYPKLIVDGVEATDINESISSHVQKIYPMEKTDYGYVDGYEVTYRWGVMDNTVSIVIFASCTSEDYFQSEVYNFDLDTLEPLVDSEVTKRFGMTDEEFFKKTADAVTEYCDGVMDLDLDKSLAAINYDKITPFITPDGTPGVAACIVYAADSQFGGLESVRCFALGN